jgi:hypothetical protein
MSLSDLASLGSFVSGVAIVVTLIFLLLQMRQNNRNQRSLMQQGRSDRMVNLILSRANPHVAEAWGRGVSGDISISPVQLETLHALIIAGFTNFEDSYLQYRAGTLDQASWDTDVATLKRLMGLCAFRVEWKVLRPFQSGGFRDYVDELMRQNPAVKPVNFNAAWQTMMAEELAAAVDPPPLPQFQ